MTTPVGAPPHRSLPGGRVLAVCVLAIWVGVAVADSNSAPVSVTVSTNTADQIVLVYQFPRFEQSGVSVGGKHYLRIALPHEAQILTAGAPDLPHVARSVSIPGDADMTVAVAEAQFYELEGVDLISSKGNLSRTINPDDVPYTFDPQYYGVDGFFPGELARRGEPYILRELRGLVIDVYPCQYNPVRRTLRVYTTMTVTVNRSGTGGANMLTTTPLRSGPSVSFGPIYRAHFVNLDSAYLYSRLDERGNMLVICYDAWLPNVQPLVDHKNSIGIPTTAVGISTIGNNATAIKSYIESIYNSSDLAFVLLVGDIAQVTTPYATNGPSDPSYALLAGDDTYPDVIIGRFSAETAAQVDTQVLRSIEYETLQATQQTWFTKAAGIASSQGFGIGDNGEIDYVHMGIIRDLLLAHAYTQVDQIYDPGANSTLVANAINEGRGLVNYCGHGSATGWTTSNFTTSHIATLTNQNILPIIFSVACVNGQFDYPYGQCFAETWLRATQNGEPTGAVATYMSSINQDWAPPMAAQDAFNEMLANGTHYYCFGTLCYAGSCAMMDKYNSTSGASTFKAWHLFGDPSLRVIGLAGPTSGLRVTPTSNLSVTGPSGGPFVPASTTYTLENLSDQALAYEVTATQPWISISPAAGTLAGHEQVVVTVDLASAVNLLENGQYADTVSFVNATTHEGDTSRDVSLKVGIPSVQLTWNLDTDPGWMILGGEWAFGQPAGTGGPLGYPDPASGATGANVYGVNLSGNYSQAPGGPYYLTLGPLDLHHLSEVSLHFQRWLNSDYYPLVHNTIEVSNNGTDWAIVWANDDFEITDSAWSAEEVDLASVATYQATVYVRWGYKILPGAGAYAGWNIDDVAIWGVKAPPLVLSGDMTCDGTINFGDVNPFVLALRGRADYERAYPDCRWLNADTNGDGDVTYADINAFVACLNRGRCS